MKNLKEIYNKLRQCFAFVHKGQKYLVTHGGLTAVPSLTTIPTINMIKGVGGYDMEVDKTYEENYLLGDVKILYRYMDIEIQTQQNTLFV